MPTITYISAPELHRSIDQIEKIRHRSTLVDALIHAYDLTSQTNFHWKSPQLATNDELASAHDRDYLDFLKFIASKTDDDESYHEQMDLFKLGYECPPFEQLPSFCQWIGGASISAARVLQHSKNDIAINFFGGWHHAKRAEASGFCYVNDIVLAINELRKTFDRVCYIDFDLHHGDGVQEAFYCSAKVLTVSLHKYEEGFFPVNSGGLEEIGETWGRGYNINVPLRHGINDQQYFSLFHRLLPLIDGAFQPQVFVLQCGADTLFGDPMKSFNLTSDCLIRCVESILQLDRPVLILGGGGYDLPDTARLWTSITARCLKVKLDNDIPEHDYFPYYGPDFTLATWPGNRPNKNTSAYLDSLLKFIDENQLSIIRNQIRS